MREYYPEPEESRPLDAFREERPPWSSVDQDFADVDRAEEESFIGLPRPSERRRRQPNLTSSAATPRGGRSLCYHLIPEDFTRTTSEP